MRRLPITTITPSTNPTVPSTFEVALDYTQLFHGQEWIAENGTRSPFYTYTSGTAPFGTTLLVATSFTVVDNGTFNGQYTVYTKLSVSDTDPSVLTGGGNTKISVIEALPSYSGPDLSAGSITNISTYLFTITNESSLLMLEGQDNSTRPIELNGRFSSGWGEVVFQNLLRQAQSFAGPSAPTSPFLGQLWYDTINQLMNVYTLSGFQVMNAAAFGGVPFRFTQSAASTTWTVNHNLALASPFTCTTSFFVDTGGGVYKAILPADITYNSANQLTATFSTAYAGNVIVRG